MPARKPRLAQPKTKAPKQQVTIQEVHPALMTAAKLLCNGDMSRLVIESPNSVIVRNN
jgi:hypothetical protein